MSDFPEYKQAQVSELIPYARNSRTHSDEQVSKIAASIKEFGFLNPIITDGDNGIVAGHGRVMAAQRIGMEYVPTVEASHLTDAQKRAYVIADNRLALDAGWDDEMLRVEFADLEDDGFDLELTGFTMDEIAALEPEPEQASKDEDAVPESVDPVTSVGDVWRLGRHRLLCGDSSTDLAAFVESSGVDPDTLVMDPPYEIEDAWHWTIPTDKAIVFTDHKHIAEPMQLVLQYPVIYHFVWDTVISWYTANRPLCRHRSAFYCATEHGWDGEASAYADDKDRDAKVIQGGSFGGEYNYQPLSGGRVRLQTMYRHSKTLDEAGNGKPVQWIRSLLAGCHAKEVVEPFAGTGATIIAAPENCRVHSVEIDPSKVDAIVARWESATGEEATKE